MSVDACASFTFERIFIIRSANQERLYASDGNKRDSLEIGPTINLLTARDANGQFLFDLWHIGDILDISKLQEFGALTIVTHNGSSHFGRNDISNKRPLHEITTPEIEDFLQKLRRKKYSDSYIRSCRGMLTQIYNRALAYQLVTYNPASLAVRMKSQTPQQKKESFTASECSRLIADLPQDRMGWTIRVMISTGLRPQEMMGLEPRHITEDGAYIMVEQAMKRIKGVAEIGGTKNASSYRIVPVPEIIRPAAIALRNTDKTYIWEAGKRGKPCNPSYFADQFKACLSTIDGMPLLTPHCCRVTYVSIMQALGVKLETISHLVGHTTTRITQSRYLRVQNEACQDALDRFDERFGLAL